MRNERGQYLNLKEIASNGPAYARGCPSCNCGIVLAPELTGAAPLYLERLVQAIDGDITFCTCQAGKSYRVSLLNRRQQVIEQAKQDAAGASAIAVGSQIDSARYAMRAAQAKSVPTVHAAGERVTA